MKKGRSRSPQRRSQSPTASRRRKAAGNNEGGEEGERLIKEVVICERTSTSAATTTAAAGPNRVTVHNHTLLDLDLINLENKSDLWGWYNLVMLTTLVYGVSTLAHNLFHLGHPGSGELLYSALHDFPVLVLADLCMSAFSLLAYPLQHAITFHHLPMALGVLLQHTLQCFMFICALGFIWARDFPWLQSGSFLMHTIVMFMKTHSYLQTNRELCLESINTSQQAHVARMEGGEDIGMDVEWPVVKYPNNVNWRNFIHFWMYPTLVYEPSFPRTRRIRWAYVAEKMFGFAGCLSLLYMTVENYILPTTSKIHSISGLQALTTLLLPFMVVEILLFYMVFELMCNCQAEITRFGPRHFYQDWWNSTTFDQFARKWNRPVHEWLLRHVYLEGINSYKLSRRNATLITFFFSSLLHELVMVVTCKKLRFFLLTMQLMQLPLIFLGHLNFFRKRPRLANMWFWAGMFTGPPILCIAYLLAP